jgi:RecA/RadA recombinase
MSSIHDKFLKDKMLTEKVIDKNKTFDYISTGVIVLNLLHSGKVRGGIRKGVIDQISADSSLGKSFIGLSILKNAQKMGMECIVLDTEKSFDYKWAENIGIKTDTKSLAVLQTSNITGLKKAIRICVDGKTRLERENTFVLFDSWGTLVSDVLIKKATDGSETKDMSLPVWKNELANHLKETDMTFYVVNHIYDNTGGFGDPLKVPGGKRIYFNSNSVVMCKGKSKDKKGDEITGAIVKAFNHKGRGAIERVTNLSYRIKYDGGLDVFYGLLPDALEHGSVVKPKAGYYSRPHIKDDKPLPEKKIYTTDFWLTIFKDTDFESFLEHKYTFLDRKIDISDDDVIDMLSDGYESSEETE